MASVQVVIVPIINGKEKDEDVLRIAGILSDTLKDSRILTKIDSRDLRPGEKFYEWERKGVPLRIEIGPRDLEKME